MNSNNSKAEIKSATWKTASFIKRATLNLLAGAILILFLGGLNLFAQSQRADTSTNKSDSNLKSFARVNPSTLAMEFSLPIFTYPGRGGNNTPLSFSYSSKVWQMEFQNFRQYHTTTNMMTVTDVNPRFAKRSAAGWTSSLLPPRLITELVVYNQFGKTFDSLFNLDGFALNGNTEGNLIPSRPGNCGMVCTGGTRCPENGPIHCENEDQVCQGWSFDYSGCDPGTWDDDTEDPFPNDGPPKKTHYVKRVQVQMPGGSTVEFRKDDKVHGYCLGTGSNTSPNNPGNCEQVNGANRQGADKEGEFLAIDGSGMRLHRTSSESILYLPNGGKYVFPNLPLYSGDQWFATQYIDADGNSSHFKQLRNEENTEITNQWIDTLGQEIIDPIPHNWGAPTQKVGTQKVEVPGLNNSTREYKVKWARLKGGSGEESALENPAQNLSYETNVLCDDGVNGSSLPPSTHPNSGTLFIEQGNSGIRACNSFTIQGTNTYVPALFNPTVLTEVELPNGQKYQFKYNEFGEITKIVYPTGIYEKFVYGKIIPLGSDNSPVYDQTNRGVISREIRTSDDQLQQKWQYSAGYATNDYPLPTTTDYTVTVKSSNPNNPFQWGMRTERVLIPSNDPPPYSLEGNYGFSEPRSGMPKEERTFDELDQPRSRTINEYIVAAPRSQSSDPLAVDDEHAVRDPRLSRSVTFTFEPGSTHALATLSKTIYDENGSSDPEFFSHLNVKRTEGYHYVAIEEATAKNPALDWATIQAWFPASKLASVTETDYTYRADYKANGILGLPTETRVLNPQNQTQILAKTQTVYDNAVPDHNPSYPYPVQTYSGLESAYKCGSDPQLDCWKHSDSDSLLYRGKPTSSRVWDNDNNIWIETHAGYDQFGNAVKAKDPISNEVQTVFTTNNKYAYPEVVNTSAPGDGTHGTTEGSTASTTYDFKTGLPLTSTNDFGQTTMTEYNDSLLRPTKIKGVGNYVIPITETIYDDVPAVSLDANGNPIGDGDPISVKVRKQIDANTWDEAESFMDSFGRTVRTQSKDSQGDVFVETQYDFAGRIKATSNPYRESDIDPVSNTIKKYFSRPRYDIAGRTIGSCAPVAVASFTGDAADTTKSCLPGMSLGVTEYGISTLTNLTGTVVTTSDALGRKGRSITNALGQLLRVDEPQNTGGTADADLGTLSSPLQPTFYKYNVQGKMVEVVQGAQKRNFKYDSLGRLIRVRQPEQEINPNINLDSSDPYNTDGKWTAAFSYDLIGNVKRATDANGVNIIYEYDKANRVTKRCYTKPNFQTSATECSQISGNESANTSAVEYFYDGIGFTSLPVPNTAKGKLTRVLSGVSETRYAMFDEYGRLTQSQQITDGQTYTSSYEYNFSGALVKQTYPNGRVVENAFESDGDLAKIYGKANANAIERTYANSFSYTPDGRIEKLRLGNHRWEWAKFNERLQVTELNLGSGVSDASLWKLKYEYGEIDNNNNLIESKNTGNIARMTTSFNGLAHPFVQSFKYDSLYRLTEARETSNSQQTWKQNFNYDRYGNRIGYESFVGATQQTLDNKTHPSINPQKNRFDTNQGYSYDFNGNLISDAEGRSFTFNGVNKQVEINNDNVSVGRYFYDGEGKRVKKITNSETVIFVYDGLGKMVAEYTTKEPPQNPTTSYTATDMLGSPRVITDSNGNVTSRRDFQPFGEELSPNGLNRTSAQKYGSADGIRQKFTSYQRDDETLLDFAEARMYENRHARFTAVDPLLASGKSANPQTFNRYVYVVNNPLVLTDPTGLQAGSNISFINPTGSWYMHRDGGVPQYIKNGDPIPSFYDPITETNRWSYGAPIYKALGLDEDHVIRLHPNGPGNPVPTLDVRTGKMSDEQRSDFELYGWEIIWSDKIIDPNPGVRNAIEPYDVAFAISPFRVSGVSSGLTSGVARNAFPTVRNYSVAYEMTLDAADFGVSRGTHFSRANAALKTTMAESPEFAEKMKQLIPGVDDFLKDSSMSGRSPTSLGWVWHHEVADGFTRPGVMRLVQTSQHFPGSPLWKTFHPFIFNGRNAGGYRQWAIPAGAPPN